MRVGGSVSDCAGSVSHQFFFPPRRNLRASLLLLVLLTSDFAQEFVEAQNLVCNLCVILNKFSRRNSLRILFATPCLFIYSANYAESWLRAR